MLCDSLTLEHHLDDMKAQAELAAKRLGATDG